MQHPDDRRDHPAYTVREDAEIAARETQASVINDVGLVVVLLGAAVLVAVVTVGGPVLAFING